MKLKAAQDEGEPRQWYLFQVVRNGHLRLDDSAIDATWHSVRKGEIFYTDGVSRREKYRYNKDHVTGIH